MGKSESECLCLIKERAIKLEPALILAMRNCYDNIGVEFIIKRQGRCRLVGSDKERPKGRVGSGSDNARGSPILKKVLYQFFQYLIKFRQSTILMQIQLKSKSFFFSFAFVSHSKFVSNVTLTKFGLFSICYDY